MKHLLLTTIAAVLLMGCGPSISIHMAAFTGNIEAIKQHLAAGTDVNAKDADSKTPLDWAEKELTPEDKAAKKETADLLRKHGGKTGEELKAEGK
jgi:predicted component of type VI protein secretion system